MWHTARSCVVDRALPVGVCFTLTTIRHHVTTAAYIDHVVDSSFTNQVVSSDAVAHLVGASPAKVIAHQRS